MTADRPTARIAFMLSSHKGKPGDERPACLAAFLAFEEIADDPTLPCRIEYEVFDDFEDLDKTREIAARIVADPSFVAVAGPTNSTSCLASAPIFNAAGMVQTSPSAQHMGLTRSGYTSFFRLCANSEQQGHALARMAHDYLGARTMAMVHDVEEFGIGLKTLVTEEFARLGGTVIEQQSLVRGGTDFSSQIRAVLAANPDATIFATHEPEGKAIATGLRQGGYTGRLLGTDAMKPSLFLWSGIGEGPYHTSICADMVRNPYAAEFRKRYGPRHGENSTYSCEGYDCVHVIAEALRRAGTPDRAKLLAEMRAMRDYPGASGPITFDAQGDREGIGIAFYQVQGGVMTYLGTSEELRSARRSAAAV